MSVRPPPCELVEGARAPAFRNLVEGVNAIARELGAPTVTSWYRTKAENRRVGGAPASLHLVGLAVDLVVPDELVEAWIGALPTFGLRGLDEGDHIHVDVGRA